MISVVATVIFGILIFKAFSQQKTSLENIYQFSKHVYTHTGVVMLDPDLLRNAGIDPKKDIITTTPEPHEAWTNRNGEIDYSLTIPPTWEFSLASNHPELKNIQPSEQEIYERKKTVFLQ